MMRAALSRSAIERSARWATAVAKVPEDVTSNTSDERPSDVKNDKVRATKSQSTPFLTAFAVSGAVGSVALVYFLSGDSVLERDFKKTMAERQAAGAMRADPVRLARDLAAFLRFIEPESAPQFINLGMQLAVHGLTEEAQRHEKFPALAELKEANAIMSWPDFGAFVAYHALKEMGAPLCFVEPKFGRSEAENTRRSMKPVPGPQASLDELQEWGQQFGMDIAETAAVLGGQNAGSLLFTGAKERDITTSIYKRVLDAKDPAQLNDIPYGRALGASEFTRQCCHVFAEDHLYWNKYFVQGLVRVLEANWSQLKELPNRISGTTRNAAWATRHQTLYGVSHEYKGSSAR